MVAASAFPAVIIRVEGDRGEGAEGEVVGAHNNSCVDALSQSYYEPNAAVHAQLADI